MKLILVLATLLTATSVFAVCDFPGHSVRISRSAGTGLTETQFTAVLDKFEKVYAPIISQHGGHLVLRRLWSNDTVNSDTTVNGQNWEINAYGGLARFPGITQYGYLLVLCHEAYHHLGGYPKINGSWASDEGESDYGAAMKCFPRFNLTGQQQVPGIVTHKCQLQHADSLSIHKCEQSALAGQNLAMILSKLEGSQTPPSFNTPDLSKVSHTNHDHPVAQARLDTYFNGAVCGKGTDTPFSDKDPRPGACSEENGEQIGVRPRSWYKPLSMR